MVANFQKHDADEITAWMCNYIAEKILLAEQTNDDSVKQECFDTILKLWERNSSFPEGTRPLEDIEPILKVLISLNPHSQTYRYLPNPFDQFASAKDDSELNNWLKMTESLDKTARILISFCIDQAIKESVDEDTKQWIDELAQHVEGSVSPIIRIIYPNNEEVERQDQIKSLNSKIALLEEFQSLSEMAIDNLEAEISALEDI